MVRKIVVVVPALACVLAVCGVTPAVAASGNEPPTVVTFAGTTPCDGPIRSLLDIPATSKAEIMRWKLTLVRDDKTKTPSRYELKADYGMTAAGTHGLARLENTVVRQGAWRVTKRAGPGPDGFVYELEGALSLREVAVAVLHLLNPDQSLMIGNGGFSYTLNRLDRAEKHVDPADENAQPGLSYKITPIAPAGPGVFGVFEGRGPCQGIAKELRIDVHPGCAKTKWRLTLYQDAATGQPTSYKAEGTLHRRSAREGAWSIVKGADGQPEAAVYRLTTDNSPDLLLLKGDDGVLFLLDQNRKPLVGHDEFSYTLNRRSLDNPKVRASR